VSLELPGGKVAAALGALAVVGLVGGYGVAVRARPHATKVSLTDDAAPKSTPHARLIYVHVAGAVNRPGLYELPQGSRVDDAVKAAGGATADADLDSLNLAAKVRDGDKVLVPKKGGASGGVAMAGGAAGAAGSAQGAVINLNTATLADLDTLPGIGPALAQRIVSYRDAHGGFRTVDDLQNVPGIGPKKLAELRDLVTV
jgi:competence protein ComEA